MILVASEDENSMAMSTSIPPIATPVKWPGTTGVAVVRVTFATTVDEAVTGALYTVISVMGMGTEEGDIMIIICSGFVASWDTEMRGDRRFSNTRL